MGVLGLDDGWTAAILDVAGALGGGSTGNYARYAQQAVAQQTAAQQAAAQQAAAQREMEAQSRAQRSREARASALRMPVTPVEKLGAAEGPPRTVGGGLPQTQQDWQRAAATMLADPNVMLSSELVNMMKNSAGIGKSVSLGAGGRLVDPLSGRAVAQNAPANIQYLQALRADPSLRSVAVGLKQAGVSGKGPLKKQDRDRLMDLSFRRSQGGLNPREEWELSILQQEATKGRVITDPTGAPIGRIPGITLPSILGAKPRAKDGAEIKVVTNLPKAGGGGAFANTEAGTATQAGDILTQYRRGREAQDQLRSVVDQLGEGSLKTGIGWDAISTATSYAAQALAPLEAAGLPGAGRTAASMGEYAAGVDPANWTGRVDGIVSNLRGLVSDNARMSNEERRQLLGQLGAASKATTPQQAQKALTRVEKALGKYLTTTKRRNPGLFRSQEAPATQRPTQTPGATNYADFGVGT